MNAAQVNGEWWRHQQEQQARRRNPPALNPVIERAWGWLERHGIADGEHLRALLGLWALGREGRDVTPGMVVERARWAKERMER